MAPPSGTIGNTSKDQTGNSGEQQIVVRRGTSTGACENTSSSSGECHYLVLNGESQFAYERGESHEQPDQMQLLYYVDGTSVLMDTGYDSAYGLDNSTWNNYFDHNVLLGGGGAAEIENSGGLEHPELNVSETRMDIREQPAKYLYRTRSGNIDILRGSQWLYAGVYLIDGSRVEARYKRDIMVIGGSDPYIIDFSRAKHWTPYDSMMDHQRNNPFVLYYHFNTPDLQLNKFYELEGTEFIEAGSLRYSGKSAYVFPLVM